MVGGPRGEKASGRLGRAVPEGARRRRPGGRTVPAGCGEMGGQRAVAEGDTERPWGWVSWLSRWPRTVGGGVLCSGLGWWQGSGIFRGAWGDPASYLQHGPHTVGAHPAICGCTGNSQSPELHWLEGRYQARDSHCQERMLSEDPCRGAPTNPCPGLVCSAWSHCRHRVRCPCAGVRLARGLGLAQTVSGAQRRGAPSHSNRDLEPAQNTPSSPSVPSNSP